MKFSTGFGDHFFLTFWVLILVRWLHGVLLRLNRQASSHIISCDLDRRVSSEQCKVSDELGIGNQLRFKYTNKIKFPRFLLP